MLRDGEDEPQFDPRHDKVSDASARLELLESEPEEDCDMALPDSSDKVSNNGTGGGDTKPKRKKKKTRKVLSIESFLAMDDDGIKTATTFHHFHGEGENDYIEWTILKEGEEISTDVMQHQPQDGSPFSTDINWHPQTQMVNYFDVFFMHFFPSLEGKSAVLDQYLLNPQCSGHLCYWVRELVRFKCPDHHDLDYLVSADSVHYQFHSYKLSHLLIHVSYLCS